MEPDSAYRRGTVFGLTIAEVFILLVFLILLALLGLANHWQKERRQWQEQKERWREREEEHSKRQESFPVNEKQLSEWRDIMEFHTPEEIRTLSSKAAKLEQEKNILSEENAALHEKIEKQRNESRMLSDKKDALVKINVTLRRQATAAKQDAEEEIRTLSSKATKLEQEKNILSEENAALHEKIEKQRNESRMLSDKKDALVKINVTLRRQATAAKQDAEQARADLARLRVLQQKGQNPPCWYEIVAGSGGRTRERAHYLFDIAVYDDTMMVRRRPIPFGQAADDNGPPYAEEATRLGLDHIPYDTPLTDEGLVRHMRPIHDLGKARKVRSYECIFSVKVWDKTSPNAKARWKQAHDSVLEGLFGTYVVKNDPWSESR